MLYRPIRAKIIIQKGKRLRYSNIGRGMIGEPRRCITWALMKKLLQKLERALQSPQWQEYVIDDEVLFFRLSHIATFDCSITRAKFVVFNTWGQKLRYNEFMNEKQQFYQQKNKRILIYIETFVSEHGYSQATVRLLTGLNYNSVATVRCTLIILLREAICRSWS